MKDCSIFIAYARCKKFKFVIVNRFANNNICFEYNVESPKHRTERLLRDIRAEEIVNTMEQLQKLHSPVGIDINADPPEEIVIAIIAKIKAVLANRSSGMLRDPSGPIHQRYEVKVPQRDQFDEQYVSA